MVRVSAKNGIVVMNTGTMKIVANLYADAKEDVTDNMEVIGIPNGYTLDVESSVMTANGEVAFMKSDGTWNWL